MAEQAVAGPGGGRWRETRALRAGAVQVAERWLERCGAGGVAGGSAGSGGAGGSGGTAPCANAIYCDDFDAYTAPGNPGGNWQTSIAYSGNMNGVVSVDTTHAYSGANSVHFKTPGSTDFEHAFITLAGAPYFPVADNTFFGRMMIYVTQVPSNTVHWTMIEGKGTMVPTVHRA